MILEEELKKYEPTYSAERLTAFIFSEDDTIDDIILRYKRNLLISQALYPELCTLEVILRNSINYVLKTYISETWIEDEIKSNTILEKSDYNLLLTAYETTKKECESSFKEMTMGKVVANLNFGFWTNLCVKKYNSRIWNKGACFKGVFVNFPTVKNDITVISNKLYRIRKLRNRIFHYEQVFKYPEKTLKLYNYIQEIMSYLPKDEFNVISEMSTFMHLYQELTHSIK